MWLFGRLEALISIAATTGMLRPVFCLGWLGSETRYGGAGAFVIQTDDEMLQAQQSVANLRTILLEARKVHSPQDYARLAQPILFEVQQREHEILEYPSSIGQRAAS